MRGWRQGRTACGAILAAGLGLWAASSALADTAYGPVDRPGPALTVPAAKLQASLTCSDDVASSARPPVLLTPATTVTSAENFGWNWIPALRAAGFPVCTTDQVDDPQNMGDMQTRAEYVVYAIRRVHELSQKKIIVIGHSQGGMIMRWPLRFWPDTRAMVGEVVGMAATNHGSVVVPTLCVPACAPSLWQQRAGSAWTAALNSGQETFAGIDYTEIYSHADEFVQPNLDNTGTSSLHGDPSHVTNVALQDICPADVDEHLLIGTVDPAAWALGLDAITHDGPADPARVDRAVCSQTFMPGVDPVTGPLSLAAAGGRVTKELGTAPKVPAEPALRCYVLAAGCPGAATPDSGSCISTRRVVLHLDRVGFRVTRVTLNGRPVRRTHGGRLAVIDLRGRRGGTVTVRLTGRSAFGRPRSAVRRLRAC